MATREITTSMRNEIALDVQAITSDTTTNGNIIAVANFDGGVNFTRISGAYTDGTYTPLLVHGDESNLSDATTVTDEFLIGQDPASSIAPLTQAVIDGANQIKKFGYVGPKAFLREDTVSASTSSGATLSTIVEKKPEVMPAEVVV